MEPPQNPIPSPPPVPSPRDFVPPTPPPAVPADRYLGILVNKDQNYAAVRIKTIGGNISTKALLGFAQIAAECASEVHLTTRQQIEIPWIARTRVPDIRQRLEAAGVQLGAAGPAVRGIVSCPGSSLGCKYGLIDTRTLSIRLDEAVGLRTGLPSKLKIAVTGCPNSCAKPIANDIGIMGAGAMQFIQGNCIGCGACAKLCPDKAIKMPSYIPLPPPTAPGAPPAPAPAPVPVPPLAAEANPPTPPPTAKAAIPYPTRDVEACIDCGRCRVVCPHGAWNIREITYRFFVGGRMGRHCALGTYLPLPPITEMDDVVRVTVAMVDWFAERAQKGERFGVAIARLGTQELLERCTAAIQHTHHE